ncbi:hypothetical protein ACHHYP_09345 [Achlya hypogyna]|uniref:Uncharacterized protein n=1 Tax=Achlya hypogyna TaxID=1202772 RepID=A0A1V9YNJ4_ACHHY|nr:hypothetical protein ACHHYP_09345 [Achlya hypogyna]
MTGIRVVRQTDFTAAKGNALQACFAALCGAELKDLPNFIAAPEGYMVAINQWLAPQACAFTKFNLASDGSLPTENEALAPGSFVILRGKSPRGDFGHVVVACVDASGRTFSAVMDPHPDDKYLDGPGQWVLSSSSDSWLTVQVAGFRKRIAKKNIAMAFPQLSDCERKALLKETYQTTCISLLWFLHIRAFGRWKRMEEYVDMDFPLAYLEDIARGPVIVTSAHIGCWELLPFVHAPQYTPVKRVYELYRPLHNAAIDELVRGFRTHEQHIRLLPDKNCLPTLTSMLKTPVPGTVVALVCDQRPSRNHVPVRFMHLPAVYAPGAAVLHVRTQCPVWFTALVHQRQPSAKPFSLETLPIIRQEPQTTQLDVIMQRYADRVSSLVEDMPAQDVVSPAYPRMNLRSAGAANVHCAAWWHL